MSAKTNQNNLLAFRAGNLNNRCMKSGGAYKLVSNRQYASRLLKLRQRVGLKQIELARFLGCSRGTVSNYESRRYPWPVRLAKRAKAILLGYK